MPVEISVSEEVIKLVKEIIARNNLKGVSNVKYQPGSEAGDGYISRTVAVDIKNGKDTFRIFLKCALNVKSSDVMPIDRLYENEIYFYNDIYPAYLKFCKGRGIEDIFRNIPICYGTSANIVALENLKERDFTLCDRTICMNDAHIELVLKTFAKVHAISYAFKDQERQKYEKLLANVFDFFSRTGDKPAFQTMCKNTVTNFISKLDTVKDKDILEKCDGLVEKLVVSLSSAEKTLNEYAILTQGDCHCNNMMFIYEKEDKENPSDVMLIDWQCIRPASPVFDLSYFFYPVASRQALANLSYYLKFYHDELCKNIRILGSDPETLYPYDVLEKEWKLHCKYGFTMAFTIIRIMLSSGDEVFDIEKHDFENMDNSTDTFVPTLKREDEYERRMRILLEHMTENNFLE